MAKGKLSEDKKAKYGWAVFGVVIALVLLSILGSTVKVPYTVMVTHTVKEPYAAQESYTVQEPYATTKCTERAPQDIMEIIGSVISGTLPSECHQVTEYRTVTKYRTATKYRDIEKQSTETRYRTLFEELMKRF